MEDHPHSREILCCCFERMQVLLSFERQPKRSGRYSMRITNWENLLINRYNLGNIYITMENSCSISDG